MGARAQVKVVPAYGDDAPVFLYTHWDSYELPRIVASALDAGRSRWSDSEYLTRVIFDTMVRDASDPLTGYGIGTSEHGDNDYPPIVVNDKDGTVTHEGHTTTYDAYIAYHLAKV